MRGGSGSGAHVDPKRFPSGQIKATFGLHMFSFARRLCDAFPEPFWQQIPHLGEHRSKMPVKLATDKHSIICHPNHGPVSAHSSTLDIPDKNDFLSYFHTSSSFFRLGVRMSSLPLHGPDL
jgi:hypothetical protein